MGNTLAPQANLSCSQEPKVYSLLGTVVLMVNWGERGTSACTAFDLLHSEGSLAVRAGLQRESNPH